MDENVFGQFTQKRQTDRQSHAQDKKKESHTRTQERIENAIKIWCGVVWCVPMILIMFSRSFHQLNACVDYASRHRLNIALQHRQTNNRY